MCFDCYERYGRPRIVTEATILAADLIAKVYTFSCVGGNLHCELDDWNIDDGFFDGEFDPWDETVSVEQLEAERSCFNALKPMTLDERASALAIFDGYIAVQAKPT